jgi:endonuclease YncB( thermonuclease family)
VFINDGRSIASVLLEEKLAYKYDGKTKLTEKEQFAFLT